MEKDDMNLAISLGFSVIGLILEYLRQMGVSEEIIDSNWEATKAKRINRPSEDLPIPK